MNRALNTLNQRKKNRITLLITSLQCGGAQVQLLELAIHLKESGWRVNVVHLLNKNDFVEDFEKFCIPVDSLKMPKGVPDIRAIWKLAWLLKKHRTCILHSHLFHANFLARITRIIKPVPVLLSSIHTTKEGGRWQDIIYRLTDPLCNLTTNVSQDAVDNYLKRGAVPHNKILLVRNFVDTQKFCPDKYVEKKIRNELDIEDHFCWLSVGYFGKQKDYPNLLQAFVHVLQNNPRTLLLICGTGPLKKQMEDLVFRLNLSRNVRFLGLRRDVENIMNAADAYVMSSVREGMPIVLLEASSVGLPIVATDVGGNREIIKTGSSGFLVPAQQHLNLANAMIQMMQLDSSTRKMMGDYSRKNIVNHFSIQTGVKRWENLYRKMLIVDKNHKERVKI